MGLSRVGVTGVEKVVRIRDELFFARLACFVDLSREQKGAHMSRFEEVINEAIGEVVLSESPFRAETLARQIAELVRARQGAHARRGEHRRALSRAQARAGIRHPHPGDLHAARAGGRLRARHAPRGRRVGHGDDRVPVRAGAGGGTCAGAARRRTGSPRSRSSASSSACPSPPTTSAGWRHCRSAARRSARPRSTQRRCWRSRRRACPRRSTS